MRLDVSGGGLAHVYYLRSLADSRAITGSAKDGQNAVVIGASFIGLEVAASLRARGLVVRVVAPEAVPMQRVMGQEIGRLVRPIHEEHGVHFHLGTTVSSIDETAVNDRIVDDTAHAGRRDLPAVGTAVARRHPGKTLAKA